MRSYSYLMSDAGTNDGHYVELLESRLRELLNRVVVQITVNEKWYLATYPDVAAAVESGALKSARWILSRKGVYTFEEVLFGKE